MIKRVLCLTLTGVFCASAHAGFSCGGPLTDAQVNGFETLFRPKYNSSLTKVGATVAPADFSKKLSAQQVKVLKGDKPQLAATAVLDAVGSSFLKNALNANAQESVPGWVSTVIGAVAPGAWIGLTADVTVQLVNGAGDAGRLTLANIAGTVGIGGNIAVFERIGKDKAGADKFIWVYSYTANLNGRPITALLRACAADIVLTP